MDGNADKTVVEAKPQETKGDHESASQKETYKAHTADDQELETQKILEEAEDEEDELSNPFAAPDLPPEPTSDDLRPSLDIVIIPRIVENRYEDEEVEAICEQEEEDVEDKHQHFFMDQLGSDRPRWSKPWFNMAAMTVFMVDASCMSSFPNNVAKQGGIAYIFAYITVVTLFAYPMVYLEALIGQYFQTGMIGIWGLTPISRGLGTGLFYLVFLFVAILPVNTLFAVLYMNEALNSIHSGTIPWLECNNDWNTCHCIGTRDKMCLKLKEDPSYQNMTILQYSPATEFFIGKVLQLWKTKYSDPLTIRDITEAGNWSISYGFHNEKEGLGYLLPTSCLVLLAIFTLMMLLTLTNMNYLGHVLTFSAFAPIGMLILLFSRAVTLDGALEGLSKYMLNDITKIFDISMWYVAVESAFFSVGCGAGAHIVVSSFNPLNHNTKRDSIVSVFVDTLMGILGSIVSFMLIGHLYTVNHQDVPNDFPGGSLIYVAQAESFYGVSGSSFFASLYYFMIVLFTLDTQVISLQSLSFSLFEEFKRKYPNQESSNKLFLFSIWGFAFLVTLVCATRGGYWLFSFMYAYFFGLTSIIFMFLESIILSWIWGIEEVCIAAETIFGTRPSLFLRISWKYTTPIVSLGMVIYSVARKHTPVVVYGQVAAPETVSIGLVFQWIPMGLLLVYGIYTCCRFRKKGKTCLQVIMLLISPEYEHQDILEDVRNAKRLKWRHYSFIMFEDEKSKINFKERFQKAFQSAKSTASKVKNIGKKAPPPEPAPSLVSRDKRKKKKKKDKDEIEVDNSAWDLWDKVKAKKEKDDAPEEEAWGETESTRKSRQRAPKKPISFTSRSLGPRRKKIAPVTKTKLKPSSSQVLNKPNTIASNSSVASTLNSSPTSKETDMLLVSNSTSAVTLNSSQASALNKKSAGLPKKKGKKGKVLPGGKNRVTPADSNDSRRNESITSLA